jgi:hypothetical protein
LGVYKLSKLWSLIVCYITRNRTQNQKIKKKYCDKVENRLVIFLLKSNDKRKTSHDAFGKIFTPK